jgi:thymidylate kinase
MGRFARADHETTFLQNGQTGGRRKLYAGARLAISFIDILRFRALVGYQCIFGRRVLVCDRFFYDLGVQAIYTNVMSNTLESLYWNLVPSPALSILLDVPPEIAQQREGEHALAYYQSKRKLYLERVPRWNSIIVDASSLAETKQAVLHILHNRLELNLD